LVKGIVVINVYKRFFYFFIKNAFLTFFFIFPTFFYRGKWSSKRRAAAWRMANVNDLRNLRILCYDSGAITGGRHARWLRIFINHERANGFNLV